MNNWLDVIGSFVVGSVLLLILVNLNLSISTAASENLYSGIIQRSVTSAADLVEHDFYKIGYRVTGNKISIADSTEIKFFSDIDNDGNPDEIHYFCGDSTGFKDTENTSDYLVTRLLNNQKPGASIVVTDFKLAYFDSLGQNIDYTALKNQSSRNNIKTIGIQLECESAEKIDDKFEAVEWERTIKPKNI